MKNSTITLPCDPGDTIYIKAQKIEAIVIKLEVSKIGIRIIARNNGDEWEFWECQSGKDFIVKE